MLGIKVPDMTGRDRARNVSRSLPCKGEITQPRVKPWVSGMVFDTSPEGAR